MTSDLDERDPVLLASIRDLFASCSPVPRDLADRVKFALTVQALQAEVVQITGASAMAAGVRSEETEKVTTITFNAEHLSALINLERVSGEQVAIVGWVTGDDVEIQLCESARTQTTRTDTEGRFSFEPVTRGLVHFVLRRASDPGAPAIITPAIEL